MCFLFSTFSFILTQSCSHGEGWIHNWPIVFLRGLTPRRKLNLLKCFLLKRRLRTDVNVAWKSPALNSTHFCITHRSLGSVVGAGWTLYRKNQRNHSILSPENSNLWPSEKPQQLKLILASFYLFNDVPMGILEPLTLGGTNEPKCRQSRESGKQLKVFCKYVQDDDWRRGRGAIVESQDRGSARLRRFGSFGVSLGPGWAWVRGGVAGVAAERHSDEVQLTPRGHCSSDELHEQMKHLPQLTLFFSHAASFLWGGEDEAD